MHIDLAAIDRSTFEVSDRGEHVLIVPSKLKHQWREDELHLRSLLVSKDGTVVSAGFPKFLNRGENAEHDALFLNRLAENRVTFRTKADGSLIICSKLGGVLHWRTRGNDTLGDFHRPIMELIANRYPLLPEVLVRFLDRVPHYSVLFEYIAPTNEIVVHYDEPELVALAFVDLRDLTPHLHVQTWSPDHLRLDGHLGGIVGYSIEQLARDAGVAVLVPIPIDSEASLQEVRGWVGREGVVAVFYRDDGRMVQLKIKSEWYVKLHGLRSHLEGKVGKIAWLLGIEDLIDAPTKLAQLGLDFESQAFIKDELEAYIAKHRAARLLFANLRQQTELLKLRTGHGDDAGRLRRKAYALTASQEIEGRFFPVAMMLYEDKVEEAWNRMEAEYVLEKPWPTLLQWKRDGLPDLAAPVPDQD